MSRTSDLVRPYSFPLPLVSQQCTHSPPFSALIVLVLRPPSDLARESQEDFRSGVGPPTFACQLSVGRETLWAPSWHNPPTLLMRHSTVPFAETRPLQLPPVPSISLAVACLFQVRLIFISALSVPGCSNSFGALFRSQKETILVAPSTEPQWNLQGRLRSPPTTVTRLHAWSLVVMLIFTPSVFGRNRRYYGAHSKSVGQNMRNVRSLYTVSRVFDGFHMVCTLGNSSFRLSADQGCTVCATRRSYRTTPPYLSSIIMITLKCGMRCHAEQGCGF